MITRTLASTANGSTSVAFTFSAHSNDGSLEDALERLTALLTALFVWIQYQLSIADVAQELIIETRLTIGRLYVALGLAIEVLVAVLTVIHWLEDLYSVVSSLPVELQERWTKAWFMWSWNYAR
jgi:hypothetical protein